MAHGNFSDFVFLSLLAIAIQCFAFPNLLFDDQGPWTADKNTADTSMATSLVGSLFLVVGAMFSGIKWNPLNGKVAGFGAFIAAIVTAVSTFQGDSNAFVLRPFYLYALVLLAGAVHIFRYPSNEVPPKTEATKNHHGNFSDVIALSLLLCALVNIFYPDRLMKDLVHLPFIYFYMPIAAQFSPDSFENDALRVLIKISGGLMVMIAMTFSGVKWNTINGKMAGAATFIASGVAAYITFQSGGGFKYYYVYSVLLFLGALHIVACPANGDPQKPEAAIAEEKVKEPLLA